MTYPIASEELLTLFETTPDLVCVADKIGYFKNFNPAVPKTLGYTREELLAHPIATHMHPDDRERTLNRRTKLLAGETMVNFQNRYITKKGKIVWLEWTSVYLPEKELVFAIAKNITSRKKMEQEIEAEFLRLRHQATQFKTTLEREKKSVAVELHEELAQLATAVKVDVDWISSNISSQSEQTKNRVGHALITADLLVDTIRRISFSISPGMLDDLGLEATMEWYSKEFALTTGIKCDFKSSFNESALTKEIQLDFFRICQQALANIKQQAQATSVKISINDSDNKIILLIQDNSDSSLELNSSANTDIKERADSIDAKCRFEINKIIVELALSADPSRSLS